MVPGKHVLYFALQPPPEAAAEALARLEAVRAPLRLAGKPTPPSRLHVSLNFVGDFKRPPGPVIDKALEAVASVAEAPFVVEFNRLGTWTRGDGPRPIVLWGDEGVIGANALFSTLHRALARLQMATRREPEIAPHMTLAYERTDVSETFIEPVRWRAEEFVLIHAVHGEGRYEVVERLPLRR